MNENQHKKVIEHLTNYGTITSQQAFAQYGITRLSAIIFNLRKRGYDIRTLMMDGITRYGDSCKYAKYVMNREENT